MKFKYLLMIFAAAIFAFGCEKVNPEDPDKDKQEENKDDEPVDAEPLTQAEQKQRLEEIGLELLGYADLANWSDSFLALAKFSMLMDEDQYDMSAFSQLDAVSTRTEERNFDPNNDEWENYGWYCDYRKPFEHKTVITTMTQPSKACGKFVLNPTKKAWEYTADTSLSAEAEVDGKTLLAKATITEYPDPLLLESSFYEEKTTWSSFQTGPAMYGHKVHNDQYDYDEWVYDSRQNVQSETEYHFYNPVTGQDLGWYSEYYTYGENAEAFRKMVTVPEGQYSNTEQRSEYIYLPKTIKMTFTEDSFKAYDFNLGIDYKGAKAGVLDAGSDQLSLSGDVMFGEYQLSFDKIGYLQDNSEISYKLTKGDTTLLSMDVMAKGFKLANKMVERDSGPYEGSPYSYSYTNHYSSYEIDAIPNDMELSINLIGKVQIKGACDFEKLYEISEKISDSREDEAMFKSWVGQAEQHFSLEVFFDRSINRSAYLGLEPIKEGEVWTVVPVIRFEDGSAYALFEVFFNEIDFADLIVAEGNWQKSVEDFLNPYFQKNDSQPNPQPEPEPEQPK